MKFLLKSMLVFALATIPMVSNAYIETSFTYSGLYKSLKTSKESSFSQLSLQFLLLENKTRKLCPTDKVFIADGEKKLEVLVNTDGALLLPLDKGLKKDHAAISFNTKNDEACHLSMEISVADFEFDNLSQENLLSWLDQFEALYTRLAGWPGRYFMPSVTGINLTLNGNNVSVQVIVNDNTLQKFTLDNLSLENKSLYLSRDAIEQLPAGSQLKIVGDLTKVLPRLEK
jgi:hypothetical protein